MRTLLALAVAVGLTATGLAQTTPAPGETASQFYLRYRAMIPTATSLEQVMAFLSSDVVEGLKAAPPAERIGLDELKKGYGMITNVEVVKEVATPNSATLTLEGRSPDKKPVTATVDLIRENSAWKVSGLERWK